MYLICDSVSAVPPAQRDNMSKMGVELLSEADLTADSLLPLVEKHIVLRTE